MWRSILLLLTLSLAPGPSREQPVPDPCNETAVGEWIDAAMMGGEDARDKAARELDALLEAQPPASACAIMLIGKKMIVLSVLDRDDEMLALTEIVLARPDIASYPDVRFQAYQERGRSLSAQGRVVEALQTLTEATSDLRGVSATKIATLLSTLADEAASHQDWRRADDAQLLALRVLQDSAATDPVRAPARIGRLLGARAYRFQQQATATTNQSERHRLSRRTLSLADSALVLLDAYQTDNPTEYAFYQGKRALALADGAYAEATLSHHPQAAARMHRAWRLATPGAQALLPYMMSDLWLRESEVAEMAGRTGDAARAAEKSRDACSEHEDVWCEAASVEQIGHVAERRGRMQDAEQAYRRAIVLREIEWDRGRLQDWSASEFANAQTPYRGLARVLVQTGRAEEAFWTMDGARARALRDMRVRMTARDGLSPGRRIRVDSLFEALHAARIEDATGTAEARPAARLEVSRLNQQIEAETRQRGQAAPSPRLEDLQAALARQNRSLVSYLVGDSTSIAFVVTRDTLVARTLLIGDDDLQRQMIAAGGPWSGGDRAVATQALHALHRALIRPLRDVLPTDGGLVIIPDGPLADLPFGALVERVGEDYASSRFLIQRQPVSTDLAAALVADPPQTTRFDVDLIAFGRERFEGQTDEASGRRGGPLLANLPYVPTELARIGRQIGDREIAINAEATEARFEHDATRARVVHVASHAEADAAFPLYSRIYLWNDPEKDDDGVLHLFELQNLSVSADLVVLSGCSTAGGQAQPGEGTIGLQYGIRSAGAQATLATLWAVDDRATAEIIGSFYEALADGAPKDVALQRAQVQYLTAHGGVEASPFFWAAPVLSGNPAPIPLHPPSPVWPLALGGVALALGAGGLAWRARTRRADA